GTKVADPYRWLEDDVRTSKDVAEWVEAENKVTFAYLETIPERPRIRERMTELWNYPRYTAPHKEGGKYFLSKNDGLQNQAVLTNSIRSAPSQSCCSIPTPGRRMARSHWPAWRLRMTPSFSPTAWPRPAPIGTTGR